MLSYENIQEAMKVDIAMSNDMANAILAWNNLYMNKAPWLKGDIKSLGLAASISHEFTRLVTMESELSISGSKRADFIKACLPNTLRMLPQSVEFACAKGGLIFKPYRAGDRICIDTVHADNFFPVAFNGNGEITAAIFPEFKRSGKKLYTRLEYHELEGDTYTIQNRAFYSESASVKTNDILRLGTEIPLGVVQDWEEIEPYTELGGLTSPLFSYFRIPAANNIDPYSQLGVSVFSRAPGLIRDADEQYGAVLWEYKSKETAVQAGREFFDQDRYGNVKLPSGKERMYFPLGDVMGKDGSPFFNVYSPEIRDQSFFNGLNEILRKIEFNCNLAYGTLSDPNQVDKTAEEIKASKQRSYSAVKAIQNSLDTSIRDLITAMDAWTTLEGLAQDGDVDVELSWDDSIVVDRKQELDSMQQDAMAGFIRKEIYVAEKYGVTEEEAIKMMPSLETEFPEEE